MAEPDFDSSPSKKQAVEELVNAPKDKKKTAKEEFFKDIRDLKESGKEAFSKAKTPKKRSIIRRAYDSTLSKLMKTSSF